MSHDPFDNTYTRQEKWYIKPNSSTGIVHYVECHDQPKPKEPRLKRIGDLIINLDSGKIIPIRRL